MVSPGDDISDFELIRRMAEQTTNFEGAREAWGYFYVRHHPFLLRSCKADYGYFLGQEIVQDLVHDAFMKAFSRASTFDYAATYEQSIQWRMCRGWLARILENLVRDRFRDQKEVPTVEVDHIEEIGGTVSEEPRDDIAPEGEQLTLLRCAFALLSDVEQTILRATMAWWQADAEYQRMPHDAMLHLSKQVGQSPETIRQTRSRAMKKLKNYVNDNLSNEKAE